ncbi:hypothetical protein [Bacillus mycoides]|uniref:hypothetical protein n=1 Tax=Bacillus mycoides TaxID=1405 RepID=UPI001C012BEE|nr:hypothetical protein [Bacillus mycoides]QWI38001.1 hypothetical protein EXW43_12880 [Bacillus mycoides]
MINSLKNLFAMNTKVKTEEQAQAGIDKLQTQENDLQSQLSQAQSNHSKVQAALDIISASLVIDETDKQALATKKKAEAKLESLAKEIESTQVKLQEVAEKKQVAIKELYRSRGELARKANVRARRDSSVALYFNRAFGIEPGDARGLYAEYDQNAHDLGIAYGVGAIDSLDPNSDDWKFIVSMSDEDQHEADEQTKDIRKEIGEAIQAVFEKHDIKLNQQSLNNLSNL